MSNEREKENLRDLECMHAKLAERRGWEVADAAAASAVSYAAIQPSLLRKWVMVLMYRGRWGRRDMYNILAFSERVKRRLRGEPLAFETLLMFAKDVLSEEQYDRT